MPQVPVLSDNFRTIPCIECGENARLVGIENAPDKSFHILTSQCSRDHITTTTFPN